MFKKLFYTAIVCLGSVVTSFGQGLHFSQVPSSPLLLNPSNTGLLPYDNYRVGVQYRNQWNSVPVPFNTMGAWGDAQVFRNKYENSWLGVGMAFYNDKAGDGILSLTQLQASLAYHIKVNEYGMFSGGFSAGYNQRTIDFGKLSYDLQWNGMEFNKSNPSGETYMYESTNYIDIGAGLSYAIFPNENFYAKAGLGLLHLNRPKETFYNNPNRIGMRPTANMEIIAKANKNLIISPVVYASFQKRANEFLFGSLFSYNVADGQKNPSIFSIGAYYRWNDAMIAALGYEFNKVKLLFSYDITTSSLQHANNMNGAFEISIVYQGLYLKNSARNMGGFQCPRF